MNPNFEASDYLFSNVEGSTKRLIRDYYKSSQISHDILTSNRMFFQNKIIMIKFLNKI